MDGNGSIDKCEVHECVINCENDWRADYCAPGYEQIYCACPYIDIECPAAWSCEDIYAIS